MVPTNELLHFPEYAEAWDLDTLENLMSLQAEISKQALMIGYVNVYWLLAILSLCMLPLVFLVRRAR